MEKNLEAIIQELQSTENVTGYVVSDQQGLCLTASPNLKADVAGIISAIAKHASKIEPGDTQPVVLLENDNKQCLIHQDGGVTTAIFKSIQVTM